MWGMIAVGRPFTIRDDRLTAHKLMEESTLSGSAIRRVCVRSTVEAEETRSLAHLHTAALQSPPSLRRVRAG